MAYAERLSAKGLAPAKHTTFMVKNLGKFCQKQGVFGGVIPFSKRQYAFFFIFPKIIDEKVKISLMMNKGNGRSAFVYPGIYPLVDITRHSLERLHQRLNTMDFSAVFSEIASASVSAFQMWKAAEQAKAVHWPVISRSGIFIAARSAESPLSTFITWIPTEKLGNKWRSLRDQLLEHSSLERESSKHCPILSLDLGGIDACAAVLDQHDWVKQEHVQATDPEEYWWQDASRNI